MTHNPHHFFQPPVPSHELLFKNDNSLDLEGKFKMEEVMQLLKELLEQEPPQGSERT